MIRCVVVSEIRDRSRNPNDLELSRSEKNENKWTTIGLCVFSEDNTIQFQIICVGV